jgi:hypothetical protein
MASYIDKTFKFIHFINFLNVSKYSTVSNKIIQ